MKKSTRRGASSPSHRRGASAKRRATASAEEDEEEECTPLSMEQHDIVFGSAAKNSVVPSSKPHNSGSESGGSSVVFPIGGGVAGGAGDVRSLKSPSQSPEYMNQEYTERALLKAAQQKEMQASFHLSNLLMSGKVDALQDDEFSANADHPALDGKIDDDAV